MPTLDDCTTSIRRAELHRNGVVLTLHRTVSGRSLDGHGRVESSKFTSRDTDCNQSTLQHQPSRGPFIENQRSPWRTGTVPAGCGLPPAMTGFGSGRTISPPRAGASASPGLQTSSRSSCSLPRCSSSRTVCSRSLLRRHPLAHPTPDDCVAQSSSARAHWLPSPSCCSVCPRRPAEPLNHGYGTQVRTNRKP